MMGERNRGEDPQMASLAFEKSHPLERPVEKGPDNHSVLESLEYAKAHPPTKQVAEHPDVQALRFEVEYARRQGPTKEQAEAELRRQGLLNNRRGLEDIKRAAA